MNYDREMVEGFFGVLVALEGQPKDLPLHPGRRVGQDAELVVGTDAGENLGGLEIILVDMEGVRSQPIQGREQEQGEKAHRADQGKAAILGVAKLTSQPHSQEAELLPWRE